MHTMQKMKPAYLHHDTVNDMSSTDMICDTWWVIRVWWPYGDHMLSPTCHWSSLFPVNTYVSHVTRLQNSVQSWDTLYPWAVSLMWLTIQQLYHVLQVLRRPFPECVQDSEVVSLESVSLGRTHTSPMRIPCVLTWSWWPKSFRCPPYWALLTSAFSLHTSYPYVRIEQTLDLWLVHTDS